MSKKKMCEICGENPATLPDRERMGRFVKRVCLTCHALRLAGDMKRIMELREKRKGCCQSYDRRAQGDIPGERLIDRHLILNSRGASE